MQKKPRSKALASIHAAAKALHQVKGIDKQTMRQYDALCLEPVKPLSGAEIRALREREHASQAVFARRLNTTAGLVSKWEREEKQPSGPALKLLTVVAKHGLSILG
jgi:putative transcriptional regulator